MPHRALRLIVGPFEAFFRTEALGGAVVALAALVALALANSPWSEEYEALWLTRVRIGAPTFGLEKQLVLWVNDLLMAIFFLLVGLEVKREVVSGELDTPRKAALPAIAATGGMVVPALLFLLVTRGTPAASGWGVPMATDIAFALGLLRMLGGRVPAALVVFLTAIAIVDDLGAIAVIAVFYAGELSPTAHVVAAGCTAGLLLMNRLGVRSPSWYVLAGIPLWVAVLKSGIHATLAGVVVGLCVPGRPRYSRDELVAQARVLIDAVERGEDEQAAEDAVAALEHRLEECESPARRLEHSLHPFVAWVVVPLFALANAGVDLKDIGLSDLSSRATLGIAVGLVAGKQLGILGATWLAVKTGLGALPSGVTWRHVHGASALAGIGFTMSLFVAALAYEEGTPLHSQAKLGILLASVCAGLLGLLLLRGAPPAPATGAPPSAPASPAAQAQG